MIRIRNIFFCIILILGSTSCIEFFRPDLEGANTKKYVVDGLITDQEGFQMVYVSITSSLDKPKINPLQFCTVEIVDNLGNIFKLTEFEKGKYKVWIAKQFLVPGNSYKVNVVTATGLEMVSDFDQMPDCPEIDSIYYKRKDLPTTDPFKTIQAIQFYVDFDRKNTNSNYYYWEIDETWEHHAVFPITWYSISYDSPLIHSFPPDYSRFICWTTERVKDVFTLTTENIIQSKYIGNPLQVVDNQTQKLTFCYSALIHQFAISKQAFGYLDKLRINSNEQGGLYNTQPLRIKGNIKSTTNPELEVLGFFGASSVRSKRVIVRNVENLDVMEPSCAPPDIPGTLYKYFVADESGKLHGYFEACMECDYLSGTTVKPSYWPY